jgi:adenylosuccinate lyase
MSETYTHDQYLSPFTWRYGSAEMRAIWGEVHKRRTWRRIWIALADTQAGIGLVKPEQVDDLRRNVDTIDIERAHQLEAELQHDLMSEVHTWAEQCPVGGGIIHLGATSMDIEDNADALRIRDALGLLCRKLAGLVRVLADQVEARADHATMAFTHLQPAEPTTTGYRLAQYLQDLLVDLDDLCALRDGVRGKGFKGAVGTQASYGQLVEGTGIDPFELERRIMAKLELPAFDVATQVAPRKQEFRVLSGVASLGQSLYKLAADLRLLQSPPVGEWAEPFGKKQIGSSAMPFKRNPIHAENMDSLARLLAAMPRVAWDNAAHTYLERTLDDSANRRSVLPEAFLVADELLRRGRRIVEGLRVDEGASARLMRTYGPFAATERLLMQIARRGADRQVFHEVIREHSMVAWAALREGRENPLVDALASDPRVLAWATPAEARGWLDASEYVGTAPVRARELATRARDALSAHPELAEEAS